MPLFRRKETTPSPTARPEPPSDPDRIRPLLRIRLVSSNRLVRGQAPSFAKEMTRTVTAGLEAQGSGWLRPSDVEKWGIGTDELWTIARHNLRRGAPELQPTGTGYFMIGDQYTGSQLVRLHELVPVPDGGLMISIPHPAVILFVPITDLNSLGSAFLAVARPWDDSLYAQFNEMPMPPWAQLDECRIWQRQDGGQEDLGIEHNSKDEARLASSPVFMDLISRLGGLGT